MAPQIGASPCQVLALDLIIVNLCSNSVSRSKNMGIDIIKYYYNQLKPDSLKADVDEMWINILPLYFQASRAT